MSIFTFFPSTVEFLMNWKWVCWIRVSESLKRFLNLESTRFVAGVWGAMEPKTNVRVYHRRSVPSSHA
ncbi:hypothetical protein, partial [Klebsiella pneumoniae]|uniref:hypothetical protein n=1 Tax=Klebsiella pneumoniae TaxID=573 RepID=UPI0021AF6397